jgi:hypothetical protein
MDVPEYLTIVGIDTERKARMEFITKWTIQSARSLKQIFEEYVHKEVTEMRDILTMMALVGQDVKPERERLRLVEEQYLRVNDELSKIIESADKNRIKRIDFTKPPPVAQSYSYQMPLIQEHDITKGIKTSEVDELDISIIIDAFVVVGDVDELRQTIDRHSRNYTQNISNIESVVREYAFLYGSYLCRV